MNANPTHSYSFAEQKTLVMKGMQASITARIDAGIDLKSPICIYGLCEKYGVTVRFNDINMEGMYDRSPKSRIHISALRPLARRNFTCAHELGHHIFGHGSTIDELRDDQVCFVDLNLLITLKNLKKFSSSYILIWHKTMPTGFLNCNIRPLQAHEYIAVFVDGLKKSTYNPQKKLGKPYIKSSKKDNRMTHMRENRAIKTVSLDGMRHPTTILHFPNSNSCSKHPTAKPIALCEWIVKTYSNAGDTILDPFMGSGAVGKAANNIGRHFIGMEIHEPYYLSAIELINGPD